MFGFLKRGRRDDDFGDIRANVTGDFPEPIREEPDFPAPQRRAEFPPRGRQQPPQGFEDPLEPPQRFDDFDRPQFDEPRGFKSIDVRNEDRSQRGGANYDVIDRLNLIESQLAAIRSMTETINERLKNLETKMGYQRRY